MIITETVKLKINGSMIKYYRDLGYNVPYNNAEVEIKINDLSKGSYVLVDCICDVCKKVVSTRYNYYLKNIKRYGYYTCYGKCSRVKMKETFSNTCGKNNPDGKNKMIEKRKQTINKRYGVDHPMFSQEIKEKVKKMFLEKYGVDSTTKLESVKEKIKKTKKERYGNENYTNLEKKKKTDLKKYGVDHHFKSDEIKSKIKDTMINRYGVEFNTQNADIMEKIKKTCLIKYGVEHYTQTEEHKERVKKTKLEKYGNENYNNPEKNKDTCILKYGVENPTQNINVFNKNQLSALRIKNFKDLYYQGSYELDFLEKYYHIGIKKPKTIKYEFKNENHYYFPDFYYEPLNLIIEIKSSYTYNKYIERNIEKEKSCLEKGYNYIKIIDKDYTEFNDLLKAIL